MVFTTSRVIGSAALEELHQAAAARTERRLYNQVRTHPSQVLGQPVPRVTDRRSLHTDAGVPQANRRQAAAAKAEPACFRECYVPGRQADELKMLTLHWGNRNRGI
jgi:hypothetical protein